MVGSQQPVVTGDAVVLDVQVAQLPVRALSILIDIVVIFVLYAMSKGINIRRSLGAIRALEGRAEVDATVPSSQDALSAT